MRKDTHFWAQFLIGFLLLTLCLPVTAAGAASSGTANLRIQNADGAPIPFATVTVTSLSQQGSHSYAADRDGTLSLMLSAGAYSIAASATGFQDAPPQSVTIAEHRTQSVTFTLAPVANPGRITGGVAARETGAAVPGASVSLSRDPARGVLLSVDAQGRYTSPDLAPGTYTVWASFWVTPALSAQGVNGFVSESRTVTVGAGETVRVDFALVSNGRITGVITTPSGSIAEGARLIPDGPGNGTSLVIADQGGTMTALVRPGAYSVVAGGDQYVASPAQTVTVGAGETVTLKFVVTPVPTGSVQGKVVDETGAPVKGATVWLGGNGQRMITATSWTGSDGHFSFPNVAVGTYQLRTSAPGYFEDMFFPERDSAAKSTVTVVSGQTESRNLQLTGAVRVMVRVVDGDGALIVTVEAGLDKWVLLEATPAGRFVATVSDWHQQPLAGITVLLSSPGGNVILQTDQTGRAEGLVPEGRYDLVLSTASYTVPAPLSVEISQERPVEVNLGLERPAVEVHLLSDLAGHWAAADIMKLQSLGILSGYPDGTFRPEDPLNRYQVARAVGALLGAELIGVDLKVLEALADADSIPGWARPYVALALARGYMPPSAGGFSGETVVSRAEMAAIVGRLLPLEFGPAPVFADEERIPASLRPLVARSVVAGVMTGFPDGRFGPDEPLTRGQLVVILVRLLSILSK